MAIAKYKDSSGSWVDMPSVAVVNSDTTVLPALSNKAMPENVDLGKEYIDNTGKKQMGTKALPMLFNSVTTDDVAFDKDYLNGSGNRTVGTGIGWENGTAINGPDYYLDCSSILPINVEYPYIITIIIKILDILRGVGLSSTEIAKYNLKEDDILTKVITCINPDKDYYTLNGPSYWVYDIGCVIYHNQFRLEPSLYRTVSINEALRFKFLDLNEDWRLPDQAQIPIKYKVHRTAYLP